jgi:hypothetical protein
VSVCIGQISLQGSVRPILENHNRIFPVLPYGKTLLFYYSVVAGLDGFFYNALRRKKSGIAHAKAIPLNYLGRKPSYTESNINEVMTKTASGCKVSDIAKELGLSRQAIYRIQKNPDEAFASVKAWNRPSLVSRQQVVAKG